MRPLGRAVAIGGSRDCHSTEMEIVYKGGRSCRLDETESLPYEMFSTSADFGRVHESLTLHEVQVI
jgi:hypothetical protein